MTWDDPAYEGKVQKLTRLFKESGHGLVSEHLETFYSQPAPDADFEKKDLFGAILDGEPGARYSDYVESKLKSLRHLRDKRTPMMYACDLVTGWLIEDLLFAVLQAQGFQPTLSGEDRRREFLTRPTEAPDILIKVGRRKVQLDIMKDDKGTWSKYRKLHLRDNKYFRLRDAGAFLLGIDLYAWRFTLIDIPNSPSRHIPSHWPYGNKPAQEIDLRKTPFESLDSLKEALPAVIRKAVKRGGVRK